MGEVWRAKDTKLGREVAIKTLPEEFAKDADRLARFEREAKLLASLNHPNIAAIHGFEEDNGTHFLVLELVEGDTLADSLNRGAIPVEDSLKLALQIADALKAAHDKGVIHRDLKPLNIKITAGVVSRVTMKPGHHAAWTARRHVPGGYQEWVPLTRSRWVLFTLSKRLNTIFDNSSDTRILFYSCNRKQTHRELK